MADYWVQVHGYRDPSPLVGYRELEMAAQASSGGRSARWISLGGVARLDFSVNVDYIPSNLPQTAPPTWWSGDIDIILPLALPYEGLVGSAAAVGLASYEIDTAQGEFGWAVYLGGVEIRRNGNLGLAEIHISSNFRGDWGLYRLGFKADVLIGSDGQS